MATTKVFSDGMINTSGLLPRTPFILKQRLPYNYSSLCFTRKSVPSSSSSTTSFTCRAVVNSDFRIKEEGRPQTVDYRAFFVDRFCKKVSPWHDIPLHLGDGILNFIVEMPKGTSARMEVATKEMHTPIKQDTKEGQLQFHPYNINWNYGLLPQTWEDPSFSNSEVEGTLGDNDPVDVVEIGESSRTMGQILKVKPLAAFALIDEGELDWKIIVISLDDHRASLVNDVNDVEKYFPGTLTAIREWFRDSKIPYGKPANKFGFGNKATNKKLSQKFPQKYNPMNLNYQPHKFPDSKASETALCFNSDEEPPSTIRILPLPLDNAPTMKFPTETSLMAKTSMVEEVTGGGEPAVDWGFAGWPW